MRHERALHPRRDARRDLEELHAAEGVRNYLIGLLLAAVLTVASFWVASGTALLYGPGVPMALAALALGADGRPSRLLPAHHHRARQPNNALALAFGVLIVGLVIAGSIWIMYHLNANLMVPGGAMRMSMGQ